MYLEQKHIKDVYDYIYVYRFRLDSWFQRFLPTRGGTVWSTTDQQMGINSTIPASLGFYRWVSLLWVD